MKTVLKWALGILVLLLVAIVTTSSFAYWRFGKSLPQTTGEMELSGLLANTSVIRDKYGIPHIFSSSRQDLFFALGVVHAQDRMFQMDLSRRAAHGQLSELVGKSTLRTDVQMRVLGLGKAADQSFDHLNTETQEAFRAYANGVNSVISAANFVPPPEYILLMSRPKPWRPQDSAAVLKMMAYGLSGDAFDEPAHAKLIKILGPERAAQFLAPYPKNAPITLSEDDLGLPAIKNLRRLPDNHSSPSGEPQQGSNNWVVGGELTASGKPLLANDPHLALSAPGVWYFARLQSNNEMILGATIAGTPFVTLGRTGDVAWGFTNTGPDTADLFTYKRKDIQTIAEDVMIKVRWAKDVPITIRRNQQGPALDPKWFKAAEQVLPDEVMIIQNTLDDGDDTTGELGIVLLGAKSYAESRDGLKNYKMPQQNIVIADTEDTIGFVAPGRIPIRDENGQWVSEISYEELPRASNPARHYYASANNKIVPDSYPHYLTGSWYGFHRMRRIVEMIEATELHDRRSFSRMQMDTVSKLAQKAIPVIASSTPQSAGGLELRSLLGGWDGNLAADRPEGLIYSMWMRAFTKGLFGDDLGDDFEEFWSGRREFVDGVFDGRYASWCDDIRTTTRETCQQLAGTTLDQAYAELAANGKTDIGQLRWGDVHQAKFAHPLFDKTLLGRFFNVRVAVGGDESTVNVAHSSFSSGNFDVMWGPSMRAIYDFSDLNRSLFMHAPGQSGNLMSPHYRDLAQSWADGEFFEIRADWTDQSPPPGSQTLILKPKPRTQN